MSQTKSISNMITQMIERTQEQRYPQWTSQFQERAKLKLQPPNAYLAPKGRAARLEKKEFGATPSLQPQLPRSPSQMPTKSAVHCFSCSLVINALSSLHHQLLAQPLQQGHRHCASDLSSPFITNNWPRQHLHHADLEALTQRSRMQS